jgi:hypothetical protein
VERRVSARLQRERQATANRNLSQGEWRKFIGPEFNYAPSNAFEWCWDVGSTTARTVGFRQVGPIDSSFTDYTVNLTP